MAERPPGWLLRRLLLAFLAIGVLTVVVVPVLREDPTPDEPTTACDEARSRLEAVAESTPTTIAALDLARQRAQAQTRFNAIEEMAILAEQNAECFTPTERAAVERSYRQWKAAGFG